MITTTFNGSPAWVLPYAPSWQRAVTLSARVPSEVSRSLVGREIRQAYGASLRCTLRWEAYLSAADFVALRDAMRIYADEPVIVPTWPLVEEGDLWTPIVGGVLIGWQTDWSSWQLNPGTPSAWEWVAPALVGRLTVELPSLRSPGVAFASFALEEYGPAEWALAPQTQAWVDGPALNDSSTPKVFPLPIGWSMPPRTGVPSVEIARRSVGAAPRTKAAARYPQSGFVPVEGVVNLLTPTQVGTMLRWWQDRSAMTQAHYATTLSHVTDIPGAVAAGATSITVSDSARLGAYRFLAIDDGLRIQWVRVLSIAGNVLTLASAIGYAVSAGSATVSVAVLARHAAEDVELSFDRPGFATARLSWEELAEEYVVGSGETRGVTLGAGALKAWLYKITVDRLGTATVYRRTSYERDLTASAETWTATPISHSSINRSVRLDRDEVVLESRSEAWSAVFLPGNLTARVTVDIYECSVSGGTGTSVTQRWSGEVSGISFDGPFVRAACHGPYSAFDRPFPRIAIQPSCNHAAYDGGCGLSAAAWTFTAAVNATTTANVVVLKTWARTAGLPTGWGFANYFALGYVTRGTERWLILSSSAVSGGLVTLTLDRVATWTADEGVSVVPGCDGMPETCRAYHATNNPRGKFDNFARFLGFPFSPAKNPTLTPEKKSGAPNGKK